MRKGTIGPLVLLLIASALILYLVKVANSKSLPPPLTSEVISKPYAVSDSPVPSPCTPASSGDWIPLPLNPDDHLVVKLPDGWTKENKCDRSGAIVYLTFVGAEGEDTGFAGTITALKSIRSFEEDFAKAQEDKRKVESKKTGEGLIFEFKALKIDGLNAIERYSNYEGSVLTYAVYKGDIKWAFAFSGIDLNTNRGEIDDLITSIKFK